MSKTEKILSWILKGGLFLVPAIPFIVTRSMYFPFITGKNFVFRILIEILAVFWVWLMVVSPRFRPKISSLAIVYAAFIGILIFAAIFGISPYKSFWSSYERMEGLFGHLHLFLYFLILGSVMVSARDWRTFFNISIAVSAIITILGFVQLFGVAAIHQGGVRADATLGNAIYFAVYLLFHLFLIAVFFFQAKIHWLKLSYGALFFLEAIMLYYTASRGPLLGFLVGIAIFAVILAFLQQGRVRRLAFGVTVAILLVPVVFFFVKDMEFVSSSDTLERFVNILDDPASQGRLTIWKMAIQAWLEKPILGWGQESFIYIFSKYYEPSLWKNEPWFDRAHNVFLDWLTASGALGLGAYLAIFGAAFFLLFRIFRNGSIDRFAFAGVTALLAAHFFQNFFVFDNLISYLSFFTVLAWIHRVSLPDEMMPDGQLVSIKNLPLAMSVVLLAAIAIGYSLTVFNIKPALAAQSIINTLIIANRTDPAGKTDAVVAELKRGTDLNTFGTTEIREQANQIGNKLLQDPGIAVQDRQKYIMFVAAEMEKQRKEQPFDVRAIAFLSSVYSTGGKHNEALAVIDEALKISPKRQQFYFVAAEAYLSSNRPDKAIEVLRIAYEIDPMYPEAVHSLAAVLIITGRAKDGEDLVEKRFGERIFPDRRYAAAYSAVGDLKMVVKVWERLVASSTSHAEYRVELGGAYARAGEQQKAIAEFQKAIELEPRYKIVVEGFIQQLLDVKQ